MLVRGDQRKLIRVLSRLVREPEQARDLAQETFWRVYVRLDRFDTSRRFGPWLFRVGVNLGLDWLRSNRTDQPAASIDRTNVDGKSTFELSDPDPRIQAELAAEVQFVLASMPVSYRTTPDHAIWRASRHQRLRPSWGAVREPPMTPFQGERAISGDLGSPDKTVYGEWLKVAN